MRSGVKERSVWLMKTHFPREVFGLNLNTPLNMWTETGGASWFLPDAEIRIERKHINYSM